MAREPNDRVLRILREIQATFAEHGRHLEAMIRRFDKLERDHEEWRERQAAVLRLAGLKVPGPIES